MELLLTYLNKVWNLYEKKKALNDQNVIYTLEFVSPSLPQNKLNIFDLGLESHYKALLYNFGSSYAI